MELLHYVHYSRHTFLMRSDRMMYRAGHEGPLGTDQRHAECGGGAPLPLSSFLKNSSTSTTNRLNRRHHSRRRFLKPGDLSQSPVTMPTSKTKTVGCSTNNRSRHSCTNLLMPRDPAASPGRKSGPDLSFLVVVNQPR